MRPAGSLDCLTSSAMRRHGNLPRLLLLGADGLSAALAGGAAYLLRFHGPGAAWIPVTGRTDVLPARYAAALPATVVLAMVAAALVGGYRPQVLRREGQLRVSLRAGLLLGALLLSTRVVYEDVFQYSRITLALGAALFVPLAWSLRSAATVLLARLRRDPGRRRRVAVVVGSATASRLAAALRDDPFHGGAVTTVWPVDGPTDGPRDHDTDAWPDAEIVSSFDALLEQVQAQRIDEVILAPPAASFAQTPNWLKRLEKLTVDVQVAPDLGSAVLVNATAGVVGGVPLVSVRERPLHGARAVLKRALDILLALTLLLALAPLLALLAALVRATSRGPVLYAQERMGLDGRPFRMLKFRTMRPGAEAATGPVFAQKDDPRVTGLGRVLRRLSLDELPQLVNVLRGEMSLVGPRPERETFVREFHKSFPGYHLRHSVKAGMTGWAQVHGLRGGSSLEDRLRYDLEYIDRWSLLFDIEILGRTTVQVLIGKNAY